MFCKSCGKFSADSNYIYSGKGLDQELAVEDKDNIGNPESSSGNDVASVADKNGDISMSEPSQQPTKPQRGMKWYKALLVILWISIISNIISGAIYFTGLIYQGYAEKVYAMLPSLLTVDRVFGVFCFAMVIFIFIVWLELKKYKKMAPKLVTIMYAINTVALIAYTLILYSIIGSAETTIIYGDRYIQGMYEYQEYLDLSEVAFSASDVASFIASIVMTVANCIYFHKRADMFVN